MEINVRKPNVSAPRRAGWLPVLLTLLLALPAAGWAQADSYLNHDELTRELRSLVGDSDMARMRSLASTAEGREIWMVEVGDPSGVPLDQRPGLLVVGNLAGDDLVGSHLALEALRYILGNANSEPVARTLTQQVIYVFPRLNPDGAEALFSSPTWDRKVNARPWDDDNDGRVDEDGPEDLNGDGYITVMRVQDVEGEFILHPEDERLMKRADAAAGEAGKYALYWEGTDSDGDGFLNEDGPGGVDLDRNFQHAYPYWQAGSGPHMVSEPETRALMDFVVEHRNIAAIFTFGQTDNLITPPNARGTLADARVPHLPAFADASNADVFDVGVFRDMGGFARYGGYFFRGRGSGFRGAQPGRDNDPDSGRRPATTVNGADVEYFEAVSEAYKEITGLGEVPIHREPEGAFFQFGYFQYGVPSFSTPGWAFPEAEEGQGSAREADAGGDAGQTSSQAPEGRRSPPAMSASGARPQQRMAGGGRGGGNAGDGADLEILQALDAAGMDGFVDWTSYSHPDLGEVEIGGFRPYATTNPPAAQAEEMGPRHGEFLVRLAGMLPRVRIADTRVEAHGGGVFTVTAEVENAGFFPSALRQGMTARAVNPTLVQIQIDPDDILSGAEKSSTVTRLDGSGRRENVTWVIRGSEGDRVEIRVLAQKGGTDTTTVTLR